MAKYVLIAISTVFLFVSGCKLNNPFRPPISPQPPSSKIKLIYPAGDTALSPGEIQFVWNPFWKQEKIRLQVSKFSDFTPLIVDDIVTSGNFTYTPPFVFLDTTGEYFWRLAVVTSSFHKWSGWSGPEKFLVKTWGNRAPTIPHNPLPRDNAVKICTDLTLTWESGDPDGDTVFYTIYFGEDSLFASYDTIIIDSRKLTSATISYILPNTLELSKVYYWKVIAKDNIGSESAGELWTFTTEQLPGSSPNKPVKPQGTPPYYVDELEIFNSSSADPDGDSILYLFDFGDKFSSRWTTPMPSGQTVIDSHIYNYPLNCHGEFYVKVKARDIGGRESQWSDPETIMVKTPAGVAFVGLYTNGIVRLSPIGTKLDLVTVYQYPDLMPLTLAIDKRPGSSPAGDVWAASTWNQRVFRFSSNLDAIWVPERVYGSPASNPSTPWIDNAGDCWISFAWRKHIVKLDPDGNIIKTINLNSLISGAWHFVPAIAFDESRSCIWAITFDPTGAGADVGRIFKFDTSGTVLWASPSSEHYGGSYLDINPSTGDCWATLFSSGGQVVRISSDCNTINKFTNFHKPTNISVDYLRQQCWVSDSIDVVILNFDGSRKTLGGLSQPSGIKVDLRDGSCWVSDAGINKVFKFNSDGNILFALPDLLQPSGIAIDYYERD